MITLIFWALLAIMTVLSLSFFLVPLLRGQVGAQVTRRDTNIALYRERLQEVEQAIQAGAYSTEEAAALKAELDRRLLSDVGTAADAALQASTPGSRYMMALVLMVLLPALAVGVYLQNADWELALASNGPAAVELLLERLEQHLQDEPNDADAWHLLAKSRADLKQYEAASAAYAKLNALQPTAETLVSEAEASGLANAGNMQGRPATLIEQALRLDPQTARGLWYAGLVAKQQADDATALRYWQALAKQQLPDDFRDFLNAQIVQAGGKPSSGPAAFSMQLQVSLAPGLGSDLPADTAVFIYARETGAKGPPLAAMRHQLSDLPLTVRMDDSQSMLPDRKLSSVDRWTLTARVAMHGTAETRSGDLIVEQQVTRVQLDKPVVLLINRTVP